jgi:hypothetical protein
MLRRPLLVVLALAAALAGCTTQSTTKDSSGKFRGDQRLVANTVEDFESAASKGDQDKICRDLLATGLLRQLAQRGGTCEKVVDETLKDTDSFGLSVESVRIGGPEATVRVKADRGSNDVFRNLTLVRQGRGWRISRFG